ncbi:MAG TPA: serine hydrolase, partial [bacterium]|nr:serine hydrolase [bacterium]
MDSTSVNAWNSHASAIPTLYALLVVRRSGLVFEAYYQSTDSTTFFAQRSVTKSIIGALTGVALYDHTIHNVSDKLSRYFPKYYEDISDNRARQITLKHLLTMSAGYAWNEVADRLYGNYVSFAVHLPMDTVPGRVFNYSSAVPH